MAINYSQLKTELNTDPKALGYTTLLASGNQTGVADALNFVRDGASACPDNGVVGAAITVFRNDIRPVEIVDQIAAADFSALTAVQVAKLQLFLLQGLIDATLANVRSNFVNIFAGMTATISNLTALAQRNGSRLEQLFGTGTTCTASDVALALRS